MLIVILIVNVYWVPAVCQPIGQTFIGTTWLNHNSNHMNYVLSSFLFHKETVTQKDSVTSPDHIKNKWKARLKSWLCCVDCKKERKTSEKMLKWLEKDVKRSWHITSLLPWAKVMAEQKKLIFQSCFSKLLFWIHWLASYLTSLKNCSFISSGSIRVEMVKSAFRIPKVYSEKESATWLKGKLPLATWNLKHS